MARAGTRPPVGDIRGTGRAGAGRGAVGQAGEDGEVRVAEPAVLRVTAGRGRVTARAHRAGAGGPRLYRAVARGGRGDRARPVGVLTLRGPAGTPAQAAQPAETTPALLRFVSLGRLGGTRRVAAPAGNAASWPGIVGERGVAVVAPAPAGVVVAELRPAGHPAAAPPSGWLVVTGVERRAAAGARRGFVARAGPPAAAAGGGGGVERGRAGALRRLALGGEVGTGCEVGPVVVVGHLLPSGGGLDGTEHAGGLVRVGVAVAPAPPAAAGVAVLAVVAAPAAQAPGPRVTAALALAAVTAAPVPATHVSIASVSVVRVAVPCPVPLTVVPLAFRRSVRPARVAVRPFGDRKGVTVAGREGRHGRGGRVSCLIAAERAQRQRDDGQNDHYHHYEAADQDQRHRSIR